MLSCPAQGRAQTLQKLQALLVGSEKRDGGGLRSGGSYSKPHVKNVHVHVLWAVIARRAPAEGRRRRRCWKEMHIEESSFLFRSLYFNLSSSKMHVTGQERGAQRSLALPGLRP